VGILHAMMKFNDDADYLFILAQIGLFGLLVAFVVFLAISDKRASKRLDEEDEKISSSGED